MNRRGFLQGLLAAFGAAVVEPVARGAAPPAMPPLEPEPASPPAVEIDPPAEIDLDLWLRGDAMTVAYLRIKAGQRMRMRMRTRTGIAWVMGVRAFVGIDRAYVESIHDHRGIDATCGQPIDLSYFITDDMYCPFDFGVATTESGPVMTIVVPERCGDQEFAIMLVSECRAEVNWGPYVPCSSEVIVPPLNLGLGTFPFAAPQRSTSLPSTTLAQRVDRRRRSAGTLRRFA